MSDAIATAAQVAEDRLTLAAKVQNLRDELLTASDEVRAEKRHELDDLIQQFENCDAKLQMAAALENANKVIEKMAARPNRPAPVSHSMKSATLDRSGHVLDAGDLASPDDDMQEALASRDYQKSFEGFLAARGRLDNVRSRNQRDMLERYGKGADRNMAWNEVFIPFAKNMTIGSSTNGSNIVAPDFRFDIITQRSVTPKALQMCRVITSNVTTVTFPRNTDTNTDSGRVGTVGTNNRPLKGEVPASPTTADTGPFDQLTITARTGTMFQDVSADLFADAPGFSAYLQQESSKLFAARVDAEVFSGTQLGTSCESILANASVGIQASGTSASMGADDATVYNNLADLFFTKFREQYASNLYWVMNRATHGRLYKIKDTTGNPILTQFLPGTFTNGINYALFGAPAVYCEYMPATGSASAKSLLVGDFSEYILLVRQGFTVIIDDLSQQINNAIRINYKYRIGGAVRDPRAFAYLRESVS